MAKSNGAFWAAGRRSCKPGETRGSRCATSPSKALAPEKASREPLVDSYDYVIVGAGSAGCVLANRLSADPKIQVLLIESGRYEDHPFIRMPKGVAKIMGNPDFTWPYATDPDACTNNAPEFWTRGKTLGGSSAINGMMYVRGQKADYDQLEALTSDDWGW